MRIVQSLRRRLGKTKSRRVVVPEEYTWLPSRETLESITPVTYPHCDSLILHRPGVCVYCDARPEWQDKRAAEGVAFSDMSEEEIEQLGLKPCPSTQYRPAEVRDQWRGNVPRKAGF